MVSQKIYKLSSSHSDAVNDFKKRKIILATFVFQEMQFWDKRASYV